jgi:hypothetical protein
MENTTMPKLMARVTVLADQDHKAAAEALGRAGYEVLIDESFIEEENAVFFEANKIVADDIDWDKATDDMLREVQALVDPYHGGADDCGTIGLDHVPFNFD